MKTWGVLGCVIPCLAMIPLDAVKAQTPSVAPIVRREGIVFIADGSGDDTTGTENLAKLSCDRGWPYIVRPIRWCQWSLPAQDHKDYNGRLVHAARLAREVLAYRAAHPKEKISLVGYSSGTHVILAAADLLPPNTVDRIILMATTVSYTYDLRPALRSSRGGIDSLFSRDDYVVVLAIDACGTADGKREIRAAGERGFAILPPNHPDAALYLKLRQYGWNASMSWTGHTGGHTGFSQRAFLEAYVLPMILSAPVVP